MLQSNLLAACVRSLSLGMSMPCRYCGMLNPSLVSTTDAIRQYSKKQFGREGCNDEAPPSCSNMELQCPGCVPDKKETKKSKTEKEEPVKSMWGNPECCHDPCPDVLPRFDDLYYKPTDHRCKEYFQTWVECPKMQIVPKLVCCNDELLPPPMRMRVPKEKPKTACIVTDERQDEPVKCTRDNTGKKPNLKCIKIKMPGCKGVRDPPTCRERQRASAECKKKCTPYPSYSECSRKPPKTRHPVECKCLSLVDR